MALADPQAITTDALYSLPRVTTNASSADYSTADGTKVLLVSHQVVRGRRRSLVKLTVKKVSTDPLTDMKSEISETVNIQFDRPSVGFTEAELIQLASGAFNWLTAGTNANLKKVLGMES